MQRNERHIRLKFSKQTNGFSFITQEPIQARAFLFAANYFFAKVNSHVFGDKHKTTIKGAVMKGVYPL